MWSLGRVEGAARLAYCGSAAVEPAEHAVDRGPADHVLGDLRVGFIVPGESAVEHQPAERPFHRPPARDQHKSFLPLWLTDDLQGQLQRPSTPLDQRSRETAISKYIPDTERVIETQEGPLRAVAILHARRDHAHHDQQADRVGHDEPLPTPDLLTTIVTLRSLRDGVSGLDALRIDDPRARFRVPFLGDTDHFA